jgi:hypothetical protein
MSDRTEHNSPPLLMRKMMRAFSNLNSTIPVLYSNIVYTLTFTHNKMDYFFK